MSTQPKTNRRAKYWRDPDGSKRITDPEFWDVDGECRRWNRQKNDYGYGTLTIGGKTRLAHRVAYELLVGPIPEGLTLDHVAEWGCRFRDCINVDHLEPVTQRENVRRSDSEVADLMNRTECQNGHPVATSSYVSPKGNRCCIVCRKAYQKKRDAAPTTCEGCGKALTVGGLRHHRRHTCPARKENAS